MKTLTIRPYERELLMLMLENFEEVARDDGEHDRLARLRRLWILIEAARPTAEIPADLLDDLEAAIENSAEYAEDDEDNESGEPFAPTLA